VYVGALYLTAPATQASRVLDASGTRVMRLAFVREVGAGKLTAAWNDGFTANHSGAELQALRTRLDRFNGLMRDVRRGDVLRLDLLAGGETRVRYNDELRGSVDGSDFQRALLKVWLGAAPADSGLKQALLGGG
jgi:Chalcone isomerase-like